MIILSYLIKAAIIQLVLLGFYFLVLKRHTLFQERRFFMLSALLISLIIPLINLSIPTAQIETATLLPEFVFQQKNIAYSLDHWFGNVSLSVSQLGLGLYVIGLLFFLAIFILNIIRINQLFSGSRKESFGHYSIYFKPSDLPSFSFFNRIFINKEYLNGRATQQIIAHELIHVRQYHSVDLILIECLNIIFWCIPISRLYQKEIKLLHEFIADHQCVHSSEERIAYSKLIISQSIPEAYMKLANPFSKQLFKKRIIMLSKTKSSNKNRIHFIWSLPIFAFLLFSFSSNHNSMVSGLNHSTLISDTSNTYKVVDEMPEFVGGKKALFAYLTDNIKYPEVSKDKQEEGKVMVQFVVDTDGTIQNASVVNGSHASLNEEALRVIRAMPNWTPGKHNGEKVRVELVIPIVFKLPAPPPKPASPPTPPVPPVDLDK